MASPLHRARLDAVTRELRMSGARHVVDLGCGRGELLLRLREFDQFLRLIGIDVDTRAGHGLSGYRFSVKWGQHP